MALTNCPILAQAARFAVLVTVVGGCTASWNAIVHYSDEPAPQEEAGEAGVYTAVLRRLVLDWSPDTLVLDDSPQRGPLAPTPAQSAHIIRHHWADTLKREAEAALMEPYLTVPVDARLLQATVTSLGLPLVALSAEPPGLRPAHAPIPRLWLSRPGFNADSTVAAVSLRWWCGGRCGHGATLLLARRPGFRWVIWHYHVHWIS